MKSSKRAVVVDPTIGLLVFVIFAAVLTMVVQGLF